MRLAKESLAGCANPWLASVNNEASSAILTLIGFIMQNGLAWDGCLPGKIVV